MANRYWLGRAGAVAQVDTVTIANTWAQNDTATLTINGKSLVVTIGTLVTTAQVATTIKEAWNDETLTDTDASFIPADPFPEHGEIVATVAGSVVTLTHETDGVPFTLTVTESTAGTGIATEATATAATGPNFWDNADNWGDGAGGAGAVPVSTDDVFIDNSDVSILYGLDQSAVTLTSLTIRQNFTGEIGLPKTNPNGYPEYRDDYLQISGTTIDIGRGDGQGSSRLKLDTGSVLAVITIVNTGAPIEDGLGALIWKGTNAGNEVEVIAGSVDIATFGSESATIATLRNNAGTVFCGPGTSLTQVNLESGRLETSSNITGLTVSSGTFVLTNAATMVTATIAGGTFFHRSKGTITTLNLGGPTGATLDCSQDNSPRTITTCNVNAGTTIIDPLRTITYTNGIARGTDVESFTAS
jgi:hypothetical protein